MTRVVALLAILATAPASADPCAVSIEHAPDDVRPIVEDWLVNEASCQSELVVRIVRSDDGLHVYARDPSGHVRMRVVPRPIDAAVLIASWAADDAARTAAAERVAPAAPPIESTRAAVPPQLEAEQRYQPPRRRANRSMAVHTLFDEMTKGLRTELDVWTRRAFHIGGTLSLSRQTFRFYENRGFDDLDFLDVRAVAHVYVVNPIGRWQVRWGAGAGVVASYLRGVTTFTFEPNMDADGRVRVLGVSPTVEAALSIGRRIGTAWLVEAGQLWTVYGQDFSARTTMGDTEIEYRGGELVSFVGVRRSL